MSALQTDSTPLLDNFSEKNLNENLITRPDKTASSENSTPNENAGDAETQSLIGEFDNNYGTVSVSSETEIRTTSSRRSRIKKLIIGYISAVILCISAGLLPLFMHNSQIAALEHISVQALIGIVLIVIVMSALPSTRPDRLSRKEYIILIIKAEVTVITWACMCTAQQLLSAGDAAAISMNSVVLTVPLACVYLQEACGFLDIFAICISVSGVFLITRPSFIFPGGNKMNKSSTLGFILAVMSAIGMALRTILLRRLKHVKMSTQLLSDYILTLIQLPIVNQIAFGWKLPQRWQEAIYFSAITIFFQMFQFFMFNATRLVGASPVAFMLTTIPIFVYILDLIFYGVAISALSIVGSLLIIVSVAFIMIRQQMMTKYEWARRSCCFNFGFQSHRQHN